MALDFGSMLFASNPSESLRQWFTDISWDASGIGTIGTAQSLRDEDLREDLKNIKVPTGIFHGKLDKVCPYVFAQLIMREYKIQKFILLNIVGMLFFMMNLRNLIRSLLAFYKMAFKLRYNFRVGISLLFFYYLMLVLLKYILKFKSETKDNLLIKSS